MPSRNKQPLPALPDKVVLLTGVAGFIPSHTAEALLRRGHHVIGIDNFADFYPRATKERNLAEVEATANSDEVKKAGGRLTFRELDITNRAALEALVAETRPDAIIHLAAMAGVRPSIERPSLYVRVNLEGTANLLQAAITPPADGEAATVKKFIFASSSSVYGNASRVPFSELDPVNQPISPYAATKRAGELLCHSFSHLYNLPITCLRFFTVYGPRQRPDLAIHKFAKLMRDGKPIPVFGDGSTSRDYTYIADIVSGILAALDRAAGFNIYNLGGSDPVTLSQLIEGLETATGKKAIVDRKSAQPGDVERTFADLTLSKRDLGYQPTTPIATGLARFIEWFNQQP